jgi:hypothetical protein
MIRPDRGRSPSVGSDSGVDRQGSSTDEVDALGVGSAGHRHDALGRGPDAALAAVLGLSAVAIADAPTRQPLDVTPYLPLSTPALEALEAELLAGLTEHQAVARASCRPRSWRTSGSCASRARSGRRCSSTWCWD